MGHGNEPLRRRSPGWVRSWGSQELHAVLGRFDRERQAEDLTAQQEWLYDACVNELEYRGRAAIRRRPLTACTCRYCMPPLPAD